MELLRVEGLDRLRTILLLFNHFNLLLQSHIPAILRIPPKMAIGDLEMPQMDGILVLLLIILQANHYMYRPMEELAIPIIAHTNTFMRIVI